LKLLRFNTGAVLGESGGAIRGTHHEELEELEDWRAGKPGS
jgi:hypothetical protein